MDKNLGLPAKKFMFDLNDFDEEAVRRKEALARRPTFSQEEMAASRQTGFDEGRVAGLKEAIGSQEAQIRDLMQQIVMTSERLAQDEADRMATFIDQAALITVQALSKTLPHLLNLMAIDQIAAFVNTILEEQVKGQTIVIYVAPAREAAVKERLDAMAATMHRKQLWTIASDPSLHDLQCRVEWTGGGADWNPDAVSKRLLETIISHLPEHMRPAALAANATPAALAANATPAALAANATPAAMATNAIPAVVDANSQTPHTETNTQTPEGAS